YSKQPDQQFFKDDFHQLVHDNNYYVIDQEEEKPPHELSKNIADIDGRVYNVDEVPIQRHVLDDSENDEKSDNEIGNNNSNDCENKYIFKFIRSFINKKCIKLDEEEIKYLENCM